MADTPDPKARLLEILRDFRNGMLVNRDAEDNLVVRPMNVARIDDDGTIYFSTRIDSLKVDELEADPFVSVSFQGATRFAAVSGTCQVTQDRALIHELWKSDWEVWYPAGELDPQIAILVITPEQAEYWDLAGTRGISFLFRALAAKVRGKEMESRDGDHEEVPLH